MNDKIRNHVAALFSEAPKNRRTFDLMEELISNLQERYDDLLAQGQDEEYAYRTVIDGIGDVGDLIAATAEQSVFDSAYNRQQRQKSAMLTSVAVALYIISPIFLILSAYYSLEVLGLSLLLICCAIATGLLVYNYSSKPRYAKAEDTLVEDFKEYTQGKSKTKALQSAVDSLVWSLAVVIFLMLGFFARAWSVAWIIFLVAVAVTQVIRLIFVYREGGNR